jgi:molybdopterin-containing oxidoreductase family iron-sulfur binding subunit
MKPKQLSRRQFFKWAASVTGVLALGEWGGRALTGLAGGAGFIPAFRAHAQTYGELIGVDGKPMDQVMPESAPSATSTARKWVMVIDLAKCDGCQSCTKACRAMHFVPPGQEWIKVYQNRDNDAAGAYWFPRPCMQCDNAPCAKVCPVGATFKRADGAVLINQDRCIGCRYCIAACPYSARYFEWFEPPHTPEELAHTYDVEMNIPHRRGVAEKCVFCTQQLRAGKLSACAAGCPMGAIYVGDQLEDAVSNSQGETKRLSMLLRDNAGYRFLEELGTEPRVWYLPPRNRAFPAPKG